MACRKMKQQLMTTCNMCSTVFYHGDLHSDLRGQRTRKFCDSCKHERKNLDSKLYQRMRRHGKNTTIKEMV